MSCEEKKQEIIIGEKIDLELLIVDENDRPKSLVDFDEITFCIAKADGGTLEKKLTVADQITVTSAILGELTVHLLREDTLLLEVEENQSFSVRIQNSTTEEDRTVKYERLLNVEPSTCS